MPLQDLREKLCDLGRVLDGKKDQVCEMFDSEQLGAYFKSRDSLKMLIPALYDLEVAMYENKILI
jgi:hypothetical protein